MRYIIIYINRNTIIKELDDKTEKFLVESFSVFCIVTLTKEKMMRCQMNRNFEVELTTLCMIRNQKNENPCARTTKKGLAWLDVPWRTC